MNRSIPGQSSTGQQLRCEDRARELIDIAVVGPRVDQRQQKRDLLAGPLNRPLPLQELADLIKTVAVPELERVPSAPISPC